MKICVAKFDVFVVISRRMMDLAGVLTFILNYLCLYLEETMDLLKYGTINRKDVCSVSKATSTIYVQLFSIMNSLGSYHLVMTKL